MAKSSVEIGTLCMLIIDSVDKSRVGKSTPYMLPMHIKWWWRREYNMLPTHSVDNGGAGEYIY